MHDLPTWLLLLLQPLLQTATGQTEDAWRPLFNGRNLDDWTVTIRGLAPGEDPERLVQVRDGAIHMYGDVEEGRKVPFGILTHDTEFTDFHLRFEYRWIGKRFAPRAEALRDAGVLFHVQDPSEVWPASVECQIQEGDTGDLVLIHTGALTWMHPDPGSAPEGQGMPGTLPELGGVPRRFAPEWPYVGRFEEADAPAGWNRVELLVRGDRYAEFVVNGRTLVRLANIIDQQGARLSSGRIALQLEGAEIAYRNIEIRELEGHVRADRDVVSLSAVRGHRSRTRSLRLTNGGTKPVEGLRLLGSDRAAFSVDGPTELGPGASAECAITFTPVRGAGRYSAGLQIGTQVDGVRVDGARADGTFVLLQGIGLDAFEGENEPPLQDLAHALGIPLDVGGHSLGLDKDSATIGDSVTTRYFEASGDGPVRITPLARFSPPGPTPIGIFTSGDGELRELGVLSGSEDVEDAHQCLLPPLDAAAPIEFAAPDQPFGFYMKGHRYTSFTDPERESGATIAHTARVYPVTCFQGRPMEHSWLIGFEEASNGDYQDGVLLVEGVAPAR